jgi:DNA topoisomerase-2
MTKTIEEKYQKLTQKEHVLLRSGMYIGDIKKNVEELWIKRNDNEFMTKEVIEYSPGFIKIFDEALTNATDHSARDPTVTQIKVDYSIETGELSIYNNGLGVPIELHKEHGLYVPELIFGHLLSGSNYNDNDQRTGSGVNGLGIKLNNLFSKKFTIETVDSNTKKKFIQEYTNNMSIVGKPKIANCSTKSYTKITFIPDYTRFSMNGLEDDTVSLINKRVYDCIACTRSDVAVYLNGEKLKGKGLVDYTKYFFQDSTKTFSESCVQTIKGVEFVWEYSIVPSESFSQLSFVNGNATSSGGKHVDYILYQIINKYKELLESKKKLKELKPNFIKDKLFLFLRATVVNPSFSSQTKELLTTQAKDFGCKIEVPDSFIQKLYKSSITDEIVEFCKMKESSKLAKDTDGKKVNKVYIPKLEDALWAGTAKSNGCTLILTEGDSAKTFAIWGRSVTGPEKYGVFPLKGKLLNTRDASVSQLLNNEELNNIKQILGLKQNKDYKDTSELRYSKVMILVDADVDGSHIKSLFVNFIHNSWPSLIKMNPSFIQTIRTPIVKAIKGKKVIEFFTEQDYHKWQETGLTGYQIRYFKGLGTSKKEDAHDTFRRIDELKMDYYYKNANCDDSILLAFEKDKNVKVVRAKDTDSVSTGDEDLKCSDKRKKWLAEYDKDIYIDTKQTKVPFQDLINKELIHFSIYDNTRSIPSICDGLKPSQRKILHYMLKKNITQVIKVAQLSGYVSAETGYHHGEASLQGAIVGMGQDFVGSNNINLLYPDGNFGSRLLNGADAASARYIYTRLADATKMIFNDNDVPLLQEQFDDGISIEPSYFMPIIPMILVNGCSGIGTGYSTSIPSYNPSDIIDNLTRYLNGKDTLQMTPWFKNFNGSVVKTGDGTFKTQGKWEQLSDTQIKVTELPIGMGVTIYKEFLEGLIEGRGSTAKETKKVVKKKIILKDVKNLTRDENSQICFIIEFKSSEDLKLLIESCTLEKELKLTKAFTTNNMYLFDPDLILTKYTDPNDILLDYANLRIIYYQKRKEYMIIKLKSELKMLQAKARFIKEYIEGKLQINKKSKEFISNLLVQHKYPMVEETFDYLLNLPIYSLTEERIESLLKQCENKKGELEYIKSKTDKQLWLIDLDILREKLNI